MKYIVFFLCFLCCLSLFGQQTKTDTLTIQKNRVFLNDSPLNHKELGKILNADPEAKKIMDKANPNYNASMAFGYIGGFCLGYGLVSGLFGNKSGWIVAGAGVGVVLIAIPFSTAYNKHVRNAVEIYNERKRPATLQIGTFSTGLGVRMSF